MPVLDEELKTALPYTIGVEGNEWVNLGIPDSLGSAEWTWNNSPTSWVAETV